MLRSPCYVCSAAYSAAYSAEARGWPGMQVAEPLWVAWRRLGTACRPERAAHEREASGRPAGSKTGSRTGRRRSLVVRVPRTTEDALVRCVSWRDPYPRRLYLRTVSMFQIYGLSAFPSPASASRPAAWPCFPPPAAYKCSPRPDAAYAAVVSSRCEPLSPRALERIAF